MEESFTKGMKSQSLKGRDASHSKKLEMKLLPHKSSDDTLPKSSDIGRIIVQGYDTRLPHDDVEGPLRKHFSSCGEITDVYIPPDYKDDLWHCGFIYFLGEGAVDKALQLNGTDVGGWNVSVKAYPFHKHANDWANLSVEGYDPSLRKHEIKSALIKLFSSYGKVHNIVISKSSAVLSVIGEDAAVKAPELNGSYLGGHKVIVRLVSGLRKTTVHQRRSVRSYIGRQLADLADKKAEKAKMTAE